MQRVLQELNKTPGIMGSMIVARDGMVIASDLAVGVDDEVVSALTASIAGTISKALARMDMGEMVQTMVDASRAKLFIADTEPGYLVAVAEPDVNVGLCRLEMKSAAAKLRRRA